MDYKAKRKLEAELKRQADLQRIKNMKSTAGINPLRRFPKEIWTKIFDDLDPSDLGSVWKVHPVFQDLMESIRIRDILFPLVLEVDAFQHCVKKISSSEYNQELRLISKSSRNSVDRWMERRLSDQVQDIEVPLEFLQDYVPSFFICPDGYLHMLKRLLSSFEERENENCGKRFFPRALTISFSEYNLDIDEGDEEARQERQEIRNRFQNDVTTLLQRIGDQIWRFRFYLHELKTTSFSFSDAYMLFHRWITLMPNIKWLEYCIDGSSKTIADGEGKQDLIRKYPFLNLPKLERLTLHFQLTQGQMDIYKAVLAANQHVKFIDFTDVNDTNLQGLPAPMIKSLDLGSISLAYKDSQDLNLGSILPIFNYNWQLKSITLDLDLAGGKVDSLFRFLEKFPSLEKVNLCQLENVLIGDGDTLGYLDLPNLKFFAIDFEDPIIDYGSNIHFLLSLQFLLHCQTLETLSWTLNARKVDERKLRRHLKYHEIPGETIDFRGGLRVLYESNIWEMIPNLKTVNVAVMKGKREGGSVQVYSHNYCTHKYRSLGQGESVSFGQFVSSHKCCRNDNLHDCVVLAE